MFVLFTYPIKILFFSTGILLIKSVFTRIYCYIIIRTLSMRIYYLSEMKFLLLHYIVSQLLPTCQSWFPFTPRSRHIKIIHHFIQQVRRSTWVFILHAATNQQVQLESYIGIRKEVKSPFQPSLESWQMYHRTNCSSAGHQRRKWCPSCGGIHMAG